MTHVHLVPGHESEGLICQECKHRDAELERLRTDVKALQKWSSMRQGGGQSGGTPIMPLTPDREHP